ncbi:MAG: SapC family protein [Methyloprofundus sp.]|nr:SapC family protein [Methyloprofundus sp.]
MPTYQAITKSDFEHLKWKRFDSYQFTALDAVAPIVVQELAKACMSIPITFIKQDDQFVTAALLGLKPGQNLFVSQEGQWIGSYTPAAYRGYPFALAQADNDQLVLCVDRDSGLVGEYFEESFFNAEGQPAQSVKDILDFLQQVRTNRLLTLRLCAALDAEGLIQPWPIKVRGKDDQEQTIEGLYRVDEAKFNALDADALHRVHQSGALPVVYCQLLSMQHIQTLGKLAEAHAQLQPTEEVDIDRLFGEQDDTLKFNF